MEEVIRTIEEAFRGVPLGRITLHEAEAMDAYGSPDALRAARDRDPERDWREVPDASIRRCPAALSFLDAVSWRFYLPAYMRYGLRHFEGVTLPDIDTAIYSLGAAGIRQRVQVTQERFETLDVAQVRAVCAFLRFASRNGDQCDAVFAKEALDDYWAQREGV